MPPKPKKSKNIAKAISRRQATGQRVSHEQARQTNPLRRISAAIEPRIERVRSDMNVDRRTITSFQPRINNRGERVWRGMSAGNIMAGVQPAMIELSDNTMTAIKNRYNRNKAALQVLTRKKMKPEEMFDVPNFTWDEYPDFFGPPGPPPPPPPPPSGGAGGGITV